MNKILKQLGFYNTIKERDKRLYASRVNANNQQTKILDIFRSNPDKKFTPFEVKEGVGFERTPITSVRRAITNLTKMGKLIKCDELRLGKYGKMNFVWKLYK